MRVERRQSAIPLKLNKQAKHTRPPDPRSIPKLHKKTITEDFFDTIVVFYDAIRFCLTGKWTKTIE